MTTQQASPGRELWRLQPFFRTRRGIIMWVALTLAVLAAVLSIAGAVLVLGLHLSTSPDDRYSAGLVVVGALLIPAPVMLFLAAVIVGNLCLSLAVHEKALVARQSSGRRRVVRWADISYVTAPSAGAMFPTFTIRLHSGQRLRIERLALRPRRGPDGGSSPHPDVAAVISHYASWCHRLGLPVNVR